MNALIKKITKDDLNVYHNIEINDIQDLLKTYTKEQLLVCDSRSDGFYNVHILVQQEDGCVKEVGSYLEHRPWSGDYDDIKNTPPRLFRNYGGETFKSRHDAAVKMPAYIEPLFKGVELPKEKEETNIKKYRCFDNLSNVYPNLFNSEFKKIEIYDFYDEDLDEMVNYNEEAFKADCVEYLLELGIDLKANKLSLEQVVSDFDGDSVFLRNNSYGGPEVSGFYDQSYEPTQDDIEINKVLARALFKLKRKEEGLEEVTASNILELGIELEADDFYPVDGSDELLEYSMVEGVYMFTQTINLDPGDEMWEDTEEEYLENMKPQLVTECEEHAWSALDLKPGQQVKYKILDQYRRDDTRHYWDFQTSILVQVL